jgi:hypothetical protein
MGGIHLTRDLACQHVYRLLLVCLLHACLPQNGLSLTHSKFLTHLTRLSDPYEYIEKSVDLDHSTFNLPKDLEE